jgi:hypothetical protein
MAMGGNPMAKMLRPAFLAHMIVHAILGALLLVMPGRVLAWLGWAPIDPIISRTLGAALLAMSWGELRLERRIAGRKIAGQETLEREFAPIDVRVWVETELAFSALAGIGVLRHLLVGHWPAIAWIVFAALALSVLTWLAAWERER